MLVALFLRMLPLIPLNCVQHAGELTASSQKLGGRTCLCKAALLQNDNAIGVHDGVQSMRNGYHGGAFEHLTTAFVY
jgi:hypothetical protein